MIIFISDLHFVDETAGKHNIPPEAFEGVFKDIKRYAGKPKEIKIVFLGDIFDLNRTTEWFGVEECDRPWGDISETSKGVKVTAIAIMENIIKKNRKTFDILGGNMVKRFGYSVEPERIYIPGNHDRLCNIFPELRNMVRNSLGIRKSKDPFPHAVDDEAYKVVARHGHEFDVLNFEGSSQPGEPNYNQTAIGDLITTEIAARIPCTIMKNIDAAKISMTDKEKDSLRRNLEQIENVRPYSALFDWLFYQVSDKPNLKDVINESLKSIIKNFESLEYLNRWYKRHDKWNLFSSDEADKLQQAIRLFKFLNIDSAEDLMRVYSKIFGAPDSIPVDNSDKCLAEKASEFLTHTSSYRYYVMGHSHNPMQVPIRITSEGMEQVYINTGTWRKTYVKGRAGGFVGLKRLTYTIIYSEKENSKQRYETWTGSLQEESEGGDCSTEDCPEHLTRR